MRVQIALDAARGLEYIHEHTKDHYVHRDIKTSNILLDEAMRAKVVSKKSNHFSTLKYDHCQIQLPNYLLFLSVIQISDFGLAKLVRKTGDGEASVTKVVGTFGYVAPE